MIVNYVVLSNLAVFMMVSKTPKTLDYGLWTQWTGYITWTIKVQNADYRLQTIVCFTKLDCPIILHNHNWRFQMSCKSCLVVNYPEIINYLLFASSHFNWAIFDKFCDFPQIVQLDVIWGQLCKLTPSHNNRGPNKSKCIIIFHFRL